MKALNQFRVRQFDRVVVTKVSTITEAVEVLLLMLSFRGHDIAQVYNDVLAEMPADKQFEPYFNNYWFKDNKYKIVIEAYPANVKSEVTDFNDIRTLVDKLHHQFNGSALKNRAISTVKSRYKLGDFHPADVRFAQSVEWFKGRSVLLSQVKKEKRPGAANTAAVMALTPQGYFPETRSIIDKIRDDYSQGLKACESYRNQKRNFTGSNKELKRYINEVYHEQA